MMGSFGRRVPSGAMGLTLGLFSTGCTDAPDPTAAPQDELITIVANDGDSSATPKHGSEVVPYWEALDAHDEHHSGHLWIVNRSLDLLEEHDDPHARAVTALMRGPTCQAGWQQGLIDADYIGEYNGGRSNLRPGDGTLSIALSGASWQAHFYDPDTGQNYKGGSDTAYPRALEYFDDALELLACDGASSCAVTRARFRFAGDDVQKGCYALGLALHFVTDISQPMHTALFTATDYPIKQHSHVEEYAMTIQHRYELAGWAPSYGLTSDILHDGAIASKALWPSMKASLAHAYEEHRCWPMRRYWFDHTECWEGDSGVDEGIGAALRLGQQLASDILYSLSLH